KSEASLHAATIGGWMFPLLLPKFDGGHRLADPLTFVWLAATIALLALPAFAGLGGDGDDSTRRPTMVAATAILVFATTSSMLAALSGARFDPAFTMFAGDARDRLIHFALTARPALQWSSARGRTDIATIFTNPEGTTGALTVDSAHPVAGRPV